MLSWKILGVTHLLYADAEQNFQWQGCQYMLELSAASIDLIA